MKIHMNKDIKEFDFNKNDFSQFLFLLRTLYLYLLKILENFLNRDIFFQDFKLNFHYVKTLNMVNSILKLKDFEEFKKELPDLPQDLLSNWEDWDIMWDCGYSEVLNKFLGFIETKFIENDCKVYKFSEDMENVLKAIDISISEYIQKNKHIFENMLNKIEKESGLKRVVNIESGSDRNDNFLEYKHIILDLSKATLQYKNNKPIEIQPNNKEIKCLEILMRNKEIVSNYVDIAKELNLNCYHDKATQNNVAREVQFVKRDLNKVLKNAGLTKKEIDEMIITKKKVGYKLKL